MDPREKVNAIQDQKRKLKQRIDHINAIEANHQDDPHLERLLQQKQQLELQRRKQHDYDILQKEYNARRDQMDREKELIKIQNEKRVLELEVAMKRAVFEGVKQKVRGMNSEQVMRPSAAVPHSSSGDGDFKEAFEGYLLNEGAQKQKPKYDIQRLNEERLVYFEKKEEVIMRQILLKELAASPEPAEIEVLALTREQLEEELEARGIDYEAFMHPVRKEQILEQLPDIEKGIHARIFEKRRELEADREVGLRVERQRRALREEVNNLPFKDVEVVKRLLYDLFDEICNGYEKRHVVLSSEDKQQRVRNLQRQYADICDRNLVEQLSTEIAEQMLESMRKEMLKEAAEEMTRLQDYAHLKTEECFKSVFGENVLGKVKEHDQYKVPLLFVNEEQNQVGKPRNEKHNKKLDNEFNVYETEDTATSLINDIALLDAEEKYIDKVNTQVKKDTEVKTEQCLFCYDQELFAVSRSAVRAVADNRVCYQINPPLEQLTGVHKMHRNWLLQSPTCILLLTPWGREEFRQHLGARISNPCGNITCAQPYPVTTFLANPTSVLLGFEKGQVLKFNYNRNRVTDRQTNITHYLPIVEHAKSGDEPAFPLDNRNFLPIEQEKPKPTDELHEYRQFFEHHSEPIVFVGFYRVDKIISIDRSLKCALWQYSKGRGANTYEPTFKFQIKSSYQVYTEDDNPRYKDIYPTSSSKETPEQMYQKYMLTEAFLKRQLYNNPKKEIAFFKDPTQENDEEERPIWKVTYKESRRQVNKILESYYNVVAGKIIAQQAQVQGDNIVILCEREHVIRSDLKTIKLYSWNIPQKRLGKVGLDIDMFRDQKVSNFCMLPGQFRGAGLELVLIANSGRLLLFSLVSGQLLKNINDEMASEEKYSQVYFKSVLRGRERGQVFGVTSSGVLQLDWEDTNSINDRSKLNKTIETTKRKYFR